MVGPGPSENSEVRTKFCPQCKARYDTEARVCPKDGTILVFETGELSAGTVVGGRYQVLELIGRGANGSVYRARQAGLNRDVAIKLLNLDFVNDEESLKRFELEAKSTAKLSHHNVCAVYDHGVLPNGQPYMICEYLNGKTLREVLKKHKLFSPADAIELCVQICDGISAAHDRGIVHRDLKPANIMICVNEQEEAVVKIIDFGMAKIMRGQRGNTETFGLTQTGDILGTPYYMSPEQATGKPIDWRSDIYALGCVLFEMVSGSVPFHGSSEYEVIEKHVYGPVPALPLHIVVPEQIPAVIKRCLAKSPDLRYSSAQEMKEELMGRQVSASARAHGSALRGMAVAQDVSKSVKLGGITQFIPLLILAVLGVIGWYCFSQFGGFLWQAQQKVNPAPATPAMVHYTAPANPHELPRELEELKIISDLSEQARFCEAYAAKHNFDYGAEHQLVMLYSNFDERRSAEHANNIFKHCINDEHAMEHIAGNKQSSFPKVGQAYLAHQLKTYADLPFLNAACVLKMGEFCQANSELKEAASYYAGLANQSDPTLAPYVALAKQRLKKMPAGGDAK
jgi:serine/threonine-protein kinase